MPLDDLSAWRALGGGALIGLAASLLLATSGKVAGISGVIAGLLRPRREDVAWRALFLGGMVAAGLVGMAWSPDSIASSPRSLGTLAVAGLLVGAGTLIGSGCTSGHGVCGISRGSTRSIAATLIFMATGIVTVALVRAAGGGS